MRHEITRVRHELHHRSLIVRRTEFLTPLMLRLTLGGEALAGFETLSPDDHIRLFVTGPDGAVEHRDYTPRRHDAVANELTIDFALHNAGPTIAWARGAKPGDVAEIGGPRGSVVVPHDFDWWLLMGDETALPAIGRRIEELPAGTPVTSIVAVTGAEEEQRFVTQAKHRAIWSHRPAMRADDPAPLLAELEQYVLPSGDGYIFIAAEGSVVRALRKRIVEQRGHPTQWLRANGYWAKDKGDGSTPEPDPS